MAMDDEYQKLRRYQTWDETQVRSWPVVAAEARRRNKPAHVGSVFGICVVKHSELEESLRKYKGRYVYQGNNIKDENNDWAIFQDVEAHLRQ